MQQKEKKWLEIEMILEEFQIQDDELRYRIEQAKFVTQPDQKITNIVHENEVL